MLRAFVRVGVGQTFVSAGLPRAVRARAPPPLLRAPREKQASSITHETLVASMERLRSAGFFPVTLSVRILPSMSAAELHQGWTNSAPVSHCRRGASVLSMVCKLHPAHGLGALGLATELKVGASRAPPSRDRRLGAGGPVVVAR